MISVLQNVVDTLDQDILAVVIGDHGMVHKSENTAPATVTSNSLLASGSIQYPKNGNIGLNSIQSWWGNTVFLNAADAKGTSLKTLSDGQMFGPKGLKAGKSAWFQFTSRQHLSQYYAGVGKTAHGGGYGSRNS